MKLEALKELAAKVDAGEVDGRTPHCDLPAHLVLAAYVGSLDAAKALHDAVLPGWCAVVTDTPAGILSRVSVGRLLDFHTAEHECNARAWLLAILRAKIAEFEQ